MTKHENQPTMRKTIITMLLIASLGGVMRGESDRQMCDRVMRTATRQALAMHKALDAGRMPRTLDDNGNLVTSGIEWWCSGFFPGTLWNIYRYTGDKEVLKAAEAETAKLEHLLNGETDHDVGFQVNCSSGEGYSLTRNPEYRKMLREAADTLAARFNPTVGCIKSWNISDGHDFYVIIDNMMNLELLMNVSALEGDGRLADIAQRHAETTSRNHIRPDYSSYHWVIYNDSTGAVEKRKTGQGYSYESTWSRGEGWALYGFTMMAKKTGDRRFLNLAENIARWTLARLPENKVPYWDYLAAEKLLANESGLDRKYAGEVDGKILRDASAGAVVASALLDLSEMTADKQLAKESKAAARKMLHTLASPEYFASEGSNGNFILKHSVGAYHGNSEVDKPLTYADYYFLEAINKLMGKYDSKK